MFIELIASTCKVQNKEQQNRFGSIFPYLKEKKSYNKYTQHF